MSRPSRIVILDRQPLFLEALRGALQLAWPGIDIDAETSLPNVLDAVRGAHCDIVLADWDALGPDQAWAITQLATLAGNSTLFLLSDQANSSQVMKALRAGARGFLPKTMTGECVRCAVLLALSGASCIPAQVLPLDSEANACVGDPPIRTRRERQILDFLERGESNKAIARHLGVSLATVKLHIQAILRVIGAKNRTEAVAIARRKGLIGQMA